MIRNELKAALAIMGTVFVPVFAQADQPMSSSQGRQSMSQQPGYNSGDAIKAGQLPGGYNQSATFMCDNGWDVFVTADYIWWDWVQDTNMSLGYTGINGTTLSVATNPSLMVPSYASGFQVGMGFNMKGMDDWNFYAEYTWYKNSGDNSASSDLAVTSPAIDIDASASASSTIHYNNADFLLQRPFYFGKKLTSNFYAGLKALWINNRYNVSGSGTFDVLDDIFTTTRAGSFSATEKVTSWALGPKFGLDTNWLLGYGIKILTNISTSVLYTRYTSSASATVDAELDVLSTPVDLSASPSGGISNYGTLRPVLETYLGLGWGSYFCDNDFRFDLSVGYDFNVHWNYVTRLTDMGTSNPGNLYLHGLNVQARFDF